MMIYDATFNFQFVSCKQSIIKCRIQHSIFCHLKNWLYWLQHSIFNIFGANNGVRISTFNFCRSKNWLLNATFNFSVVVFEDLIIDDNILFAFFFLCKTMGCQLQHSILYSYDVYIRSFTFEFRRFVSEIRITGVNIQYAEVRAVGWTKSARTGKDSTLGHSTLNVV